VSAGRLPVGIHARSPEKTVEAQEVRSFLYPRHLILTTISGILYSQDFGTVSWAYLSRVPGGLLPGGV
jgi:hypothetical protein